jgi:hypothetical protein
MDSGNRAPPTFFSQVLVVPERRAFIWDAFGTSKCYLGWDKRLSHRGFIGNIPGYDGHMDWRERKRWHSYGIHTFPQRHS